MGLKLQAILLGVLTCLILGGSGVFLLDRLAVANQEALHYARETDAAVVALERAHLALQNQIREWKNTLLRGREEASFRKYKGQFEAASQATVKYLDTARGLMTQAVIPTTEVDEVLKHHVALNARYTEELKRFEPADPESGFKVDLALRGVDRPLGEAMSALVQHVEGLAERRLFERRVNAEEVHLITLGEYLALVLLTTAVSIFLSRRGIHGLLATLGGEPAEAHEIAQRIAQGDLSQDLEDRYAADSLLGALADMQIRLREMVAYLAQSVDALQAAAAAAATSARQIAAGSAQQSNSTQAMAAAVEELTISIAIIADQAKTARGLVQRSASNCGEGAAAVEAVVVEIDRLAATVSQSAEEIGALHVRSEQIAQVVNVIDAIADQTNLLALNAATEAARAGDQGRGFAVVADEVRSLAARTAKSTSEIADVVRTIQSGTQGAVQTMQAGTERVNQGVEMARRAGQAMVRVKDGGQEVGQAMSSIGAALDEQSATANLLSRNVETVANVAVEYSAATAGVAATAERLQDIAQDLHRTVSRFRLVAVPA